MVMSRWLVKLTTLYSWASLDLAVYQFTVHIFACNWQQHFLNQRKEENDHRNIFHDTSPQKYGDILGSNSQPMDQQLDCLSIVLQDPACIYIYNVWQTIFSFNLC